MKNDLVVFLGPSLPAEEARRIVSCAVLAPARQGDVWRALSLHPRAIVLIDGVFEAVPSVWHHEILDALDAGVAVFGASSMGALRAAELESHGMRGVGRIFERYRSGELVDDSEVALLHAPAEHGFRPLTVPLVAVRDAASRAQQARVLDRQEAAGLVEAAEATFYQERSWPQLLSNTGWPEAKVGQFKDWLRANPVDPKAEDARECLEHAAKFLRTAPPKKKKRLDRPGPTRRPSSLVRRRRLFEGETQGVSGERVMAELWRRKDADELAESGLRRALLAGWARQQGLSIPTAELDAEMAEWSKATGGSRDDEDARVVLEDALLEVKVLEHAARMLPDGPGRDEALASEARLHGLWQDTVSRLAARKRR